MNKMTRALNRIACFANCHPMAAIAIAFAGVVAIAGLVIMALMR
jgi:hypothetical protein